MAWVPWRTSAAARLEQRQNVSGQTSLSELDEQELSIESLSSSKAKTYVFLQACVPVVDEFLWRLSIRSAEPSIERHATIVKKWKIGMLILRKVMAFGEKGLGGGVVIENHHGKAVPLYTCSCFETSLLNRIGSVSLCIARKASIAGHLLKYFDSRPPIASLFKCGCLIKREV